MKKDRDLYYKKIVAIRSVEFAAKDLNVEVPYIDFIHQEKFPNQFITSMFIPEEYVVLFNQSWLSSIKIEDIILTSFHETRHVYQWIQINKGNPKETPETIKKWKNEFANYTQPKSGYYEINYITQDIEIDATEYSKSKFMNICLINQID